MKLEGKVAIVTGGARDLGRAISVKLAAEGAKVCLNYFDNEADAQETLALIKNVGGEAIAVQGDMTKAAAVKNLFAECNKAFGDKVDVLVNVVGGIVGRKKITEQDEDWYDFLMDVNMRSVFFVPGEVVPMPPEGGSIVNFSIGCPRRRWQWSFHVCNRERCGNDIYPFHGEGTRPSGNPLQRYLSRHDCHFFPRPFQYAGKPRTYEGFLRIAS